MAKSRKRKRKEEKEKKEREKKEQEKKEKEGANNSEQAPFIASGDTINKDETDKKNFQEAILSAITNLNATLMNLGADPASKKNVNVVSSDNESEG